jgi:hypothetical protein
MRPGWPWSSMWIVAWLLAAVGPAQAIPTPDSAQIALLQSAGDSARWVRVTTRRGLFETTRPSFDPEGVRIVSTHGRAALLTVGSAGVPVRLVQWGDVERLDTGRSRMGQGTLIGLVVGAGMGAIELSNGPDGFEKGDHVMVYFAALTTATMILAGFLIGASSTQWTRMLP